VSFEDERRAVETRFSGAYSSTPVKYENAIFDQPNNSSWVALTLLSGGGINASIGTTRPVKRFSGIIQIDIYTPEQGGTKAARDLGDLVAAVFDNVQFSVGSSGTITTRVPSLSTMGVQNGWYHAVVSVAYHRDKIG